MMDMSKPNFFSRFPLLGLLVVVLLLSACSLAQVTPTEVPAVDPEMPTATTLAQPTPTPAPAALIVNGERIPLYWFESELARYKLAQEKMGTPVTDEGAAADVVLQDIIDQVLLAQGAFEAGYDVTNEMVQEKVEELRAEADLAQWMADWGYDESALYQGLKLQMLATYQREKILASVSTSAEQVKLQQIFAYTQEGANNALLSLNSGADFDDVALIYDPAAGGQIGWVPRGYLLFPAVEEAAFSLPVGTYSDIIETEIGFHIIRVLDREERPLTTDALLMLQRKALYSWLEERRANSVIEILVNAP